MVDCFAGLKADLLTESDALDLLADLTKMLNDNDVGSLPSKGLNITPETWQGMLDNLQFALDHADEQGISNAAKQALARARNRVSAFMRLIVEPQVQYADQGTLKPFIDNLDFLLSLQDKPNFWKDYGPVQGWFTQEMLENTYGIRISAFLTSPLQLDFDVLSAEDLYDSGLLNRLLKLRHASGEPFTIWHLKGGWPEAFNKFATKKADAYVTKAIQIFEAFNPGETLDFDGWPGIPPKAKLQIVESLLDAQGKDSWSWPKIQTFDPPPLGQLVQSLTDSDDVVQTFTEQVAKLKALGLNVNETVLDAEPLEDTVAALKEYFDLDPLFDATDLEALSNKYIVPWVPEPDSDVGLWWNHLAQTSTVGSTPEIQSKALQNWYDGYGALLDSGFEFSIAPTPNQISDLHTIGLKKALVDNAATASWGEVYQEELEALLAKLQGSSNVVSFKKGKWWDALWTELKSGAGPDLEHWPGAAVSWSKGYQKLLDQGYDFVDAPGPGLGFGQLYKLSSDVVDVPSVIDALLDYDMIAPTHFNKSIGQWWDALEVMSKAVPEQDFPSLQLAYQKLLAQGYDFELAPNLDDFGLLGKLATGDDAFVPLFDSAAMKLVDEAPPKGKWWGLLNALPEGAVYEDYWRAGYAKLLKAGYDFDLPISALPEKTLMDVAYSLSNIGANLPVSMVDVDPLEKLITNQTLKNLAGLSVQDDLIGTHQVGRWWNQVLKLDDDQLTGAYRVLLKNGRDFDSDVVEGLIQEYLLEVYNADTVDLIDPDWFLWSDPNLTSVNLLTTDSPAVVGKWWPQVNKYLDGHPSSFKVLSKYQALLEQGYDFVDEPGIEHIAATLGTGLNVSAIIDDSLAWGDYAMIKKVAKVDLPEGQWWKQINALAAKATPEVAQELRELYALALKSGYDFPLPPSFDDVLALINTSGNFADEVGQGKLLIGKKALTKTKKGKWSAKVDELVSGGYQPTWLKTIYDEAVAAGYELSDLSSLKGLTYGVEDAFKHTPEVWDDYIGLGPNAASNMGEYIDDFMFVSQNTGQDLFDSLEAGGYFVKASNAALANAVDEASEALAGTATALKAPPQIKPVGLWWDEVKHVGFSLNDIELTYNQLLQKGYDLVYDPDVMSGQPGDVLKQIYFNTVDADGLDHYLDTQWKKGQLTKLSSFSKTQLEFDSLKLSDQAAEIKAAFTLAGEDLLPEGMDPQMFETILDLTSGNTSAWDYAKTLQKGAVTQEYKDIHDKYMLWKKQSVMVDAMTPDPEVFGWTSPDSITQFLSLSVPDQAQEILDAVENLGYQYLSNNEYMKKYYAQDIASHLQHLKSQLEEYASPDWWTQDIGDYLKWKKAKFGSVADEYPTAFKNLKWSEQAQEMLDGAEAGWLPKAINIDPVDGEGLGYIQSKTTPLWAGPYKSGESDVWDALVEEFIEWKIPQLEPADPGLKAAAFKNLDLHGQSSHMASALAQGKWKPSSEAQAVQAMKTALGDTSKYIEGDNHLWTSLVDDYLKQVYGVENKKTSSGSWMVNTFENLAPTQQVAQIIVDWPTFSSEVSDLLTDTQKAQPAIQLLAPIFDPDGDADPLLRELIVKQYSAWKFDSAEPKMFTELDLWSQKNMMLGDPEFSNFLFDTGMDDYDWIGHIEASFADPNVHDPLLQTVIESYDSWHKSKAGTGPLDGSFDDPLFQFLKDTPPKPATLGKAPHVSWVEVDVPPTQSKWTQNDWYKVNKALADQFIADHPEYPEVGYSLPYLNKAELQTWNAAWHKGDLAEVWLIDDAFAGGKALSAHPGAKLETFTEQLKNHGKIKYKAWDSVFPTNDLDPLGEASDYTKLLFGQTHHPDGTVSTMMDFIAQQHKDGNWEVLNAVEWQMLDDPKPYDVYPKLLDMLTKTHGGVEDSVSAMKLVPDAPDFPPWAGDKLPGDMSALTAGTWNSKAKNQDIVEKFVSWFNAEYPQHHIGQLMHHADNFDLLPWLKAVQNGDFGEAFEIEQKVAAKLGEKMWESDHPGFGVPSFLKQKQKNAGMVIQKAWKSPYLPGSTLGHLQIETLDEFYEKIDDYIYHLWGIKADDLADQIFAVHEEGLLQQGWTKIQQGWTKNTVKQQLIDISKQHWQDTDSLIVWATELMDSGEVDPDWIDKIWKTALEISGEYWSDKDNVPFPGIQLVQSAVPVTSGQPKLVDATDTFKLKTIGEQASEMLEVVTQGIWSPSDEVLSGVSLNYKSPEAWLNNLLASDTSYPEFAKLYAYDPETSYLKLVDEYLDWKKTQAPGADVTGKVFPTSKLMKGDWPVVQKQYMKALYGTDIPSPNEAQIQVAKYHYMQDQAKLDQWSDWILDPVNSDMPSVDSDIYKAVKQVAENWDGSDYIDGGPTLKAVEIHYAGSGNVGQLSWDKDLGQWVLDGASFDLSDIDQMILEKVEDLPLQQLKTGAAPVRTTPPGPDLSLYDSIDEVVYGRVGHPEDPPPLKLAAKQKELGGTHPKATYEAPNQEKFVFKPAPRPYGTGPVEEFRPEVEHAAHEVAELFGFDMSDSWIIRGEFRGQRNVYGQLQSWVTGKNLVGVEPSDLTARERRLVAIEHVFDWILDNDDTHAANLVRHGGRITSVDKGRAWKHLGSNELALGRLNTNATTYYSRLYQYLENASQGELDAMYRDVKFKIFKVNEIYEERGDEYRSILRRAFKNRPWPGSMTEDRYITQITDRIGELDADFDALWDQIYRRAGYERPDIDVSQLSFDVGGGRFDGLHRGFTQEFLDDVNRSGSHGMSTFYRSDKIEKAAEMSWFERDGPADVFRSEMKLLPTDDEAEFVERLRAWAKDESGMWQPNVFWEGESEFVDQLTAAAKTVSYHSTDGNYNQDKVGKLERLKESIYNMRQALREGNEDWLGPYDKQSFLDVLSAYEDSITEIEEAMANQTKAPHINRLKIELVDDPTVRERFSPWDVSRVQELTHRVGVSKTDLKYDPATGLVDMAGTEVRWGTGQDRTHFPAEHYIIRVTDKIQVNYTPATDPLKSAAGRLRVTVSDYTNQSDLLEYRRFLKEAVQLDLTPADNDDLELTYWRMYLSASQHYSDADHFQPAFDYWKSEVAKRPLMSARAEIDVIKDGLRQIGQTDDMLEPTDGMWWRPRGHLSNPNAPDLETGQTYFLRHDVLYDDLTDALRDRPFSLYLTGDTDREAIATSGGMLATEERKRLIRRTMYSKSPGDDMKYGSANTVFVHKFSPSYDVYISPDVARRLDSYYFTSDSYGRLSDRPTSAMFNIVEGLRTGYQDSSAEIMVRDRVSFLDDILIMTFTDYDERDRVLDFFRDRGIYEIRGLSIEDRFVMTSNRERAWKKAMEVWRSRPWWQR